MFESLSGQLEGIFRKLTGRGRLSESDLDEAAATIRRALLEADVNYTVAENFCETLRKRCSGQEIVRGSDGAHELSVHASDLAGHVADEKSPKIVVDTKTDFTVHKPTWK